MHFLVLAALSLLTSSALAAPTGLVQLGKREEALINPALAEMGYVSDPEPNRNYYSGTTILFTYRPATAPGFFTQYINVNLNTPDSTFVLGTHLVSGPNDRGAISRAFRIPDGIFFYLGPSGQGKAFIQVTEYQAPRPGYDNAPIYPNATPIYLFSRFGPGSAGPGKALEVEGSGEVLEVAGTGEGTEAAAPGEVVEAAAPEEVVAV